MSERRERCREFVMNFYLHLNRRGPEADTDALEAFAKQEQIRGMEAALCIVVDEKMKHASISMGDMVCEEVGERIATEIAKLKEGG